MCFIIDACQLAAMVMQTGQLTAETNLAAQADDFFTQTAYNQAQMVSPDMRPGLDQDFLRRAGENELFENGAAAWIVDCGCQFTLRKS